MLKLYIARYIGCTAALTAGCMLFRVEFGFSLFAWAALLAAVYVLVKPLYSLLVLPLDMLLCGLGTLLLDALFVLIAAPYPFAYWQALLIAAVIALCFTPYEMLRKSH